MRYDADISTSRPVTYVYGKYADTVNKETTKEFIIDEFPSIYGYL